ncbi:DUF1801 domain-containing protein [Flavobacterium sedimenticola]|uniref:DUF1801 domain-containing protein n=1 Tax=Flavobacterium sedimenticola TaxID=3043286 RepID=A0ABT6XNP1_9FLAO|nr:DUF1801 domain-containing protein [Flavobacterium sedimenticola]MDI9256708.1 DUF1801 domain-containing protein [Flavobacterium sedimenticola]
MKPTELYILNQPEPYRSMLLHIVSVVEHALPNVTLEFKWGIPYFYYKKKPLCYLNASHKHQYVDVGFARGFQLTQNTAFLIADKGRNTVKSLRYRSLYEIDNEVLTAVLAEAQNLY